MKILLIDLATGIVLSEVDGLASLPAGLGAVDGDVYAESTLGAALAWPRLARDAGLATADWVFGAARWAELDEAARTAWSSWRRAMLDLPATHPSPLDVPWPTRPDGVVPVAAADVAATVPLSTRPLADWHGFETMGAPDPILREELAAARAARTQAAQNEEIHHG